MTILEEIGEGEVLAQLAEECAELAQAALKLRRAIDGKNPTPKSVEECREALIEEIADVELCRFVLDLTDSENKDLNRFVLKKYRRWANRLEDTEK